MSIDYNLLKPKKSLDLDALTTEKIEQDFDEIIRQNNLHELIEEASHPEEVIETAYKNLNLLVDVHINLLDDVDEVIGHELPEERKEELEALIRDDALILIAARTSAEHKRVIDPEDDYSDVSGLAIDARMRDLEALGRAWMITGEKTIEEGVKIIAKGLPVHTTRPLLHAIELARTNQEAFDDIYSDEKRTENKKRLGVIGMIEHLGQRMTLTPDEIRIGEQRGELINPSRKERNLFRKEGTTTTVLGDVALNLSKRFRK